MSYKFTVNNPRGKHTRYLFEL